MIKKTSLHLGVDPGPEITNSGVNSWVSGASATNSPRNNTNDGVSLMQWATRVSLARVPTTGSGTHHAGEDLVLSVGRLAGSISDVWDGNLEESLGSASTLADCSPAGGD